MDNSMVPNTLHQQDYAFKALNSTIHSVDMVITGDIGLSTVYMYFIFLHFPAVT